MVETGHVMSSESNYNNDLMWSQVDYKDGILVPVLVINVMVALLRREALLVIVLKKVDCSVRDTGQTSAVTEASGTSDHTLPTQLF